MNESLSEIDCSYYKNKYNLDLDYQSLAQHYLKYGKKKDIF